jgi:hypothetical protein
MNRPTGTLLIVTLLVLSACVLGTGNYMPIVNTKFHNIGETVVNGYVAIELRGVRQLTSIGLYEPDPGNIYAVVDVRLEAVEDDQYVSKSDFTVIQSDNSVHDYAFATYFLEDPFESTSLDIGQWTDGEIVFEVEPADYYILEFEDYPGDPIRFWFTLGGEHVVCPPDMPSGPSAGQRYHLLAFFTEGAHCSWEHAVEYRFDFGDDYMSDWSCSQDASHAYSTNGAYEVRAQARCSVNPGVVSSWSSPKTVNVPAFYDIGDAAANGYVTIELRGVRQLTSIGWYEPDPGNVYAVVDVCLEAVEDDQYVWESDFTVIQSDNSVHDYAFATYFLEDPLESTSLDIGQWTDGEIAFEVQPADYYILEFEDYPGEPIRFWFTLFEVQEPSITEFTSAEGTNGACYTETDLAYVKVTDASFAGQSGIIGAVEIEGNLYDLFPLGGSAAGAFTTGPISIAALGKVAGDTITATYRDPSNLADSSSATTSITAGTCTTCSNELIHDGWHMVALPGELCGECDIDDSGDLVCALSDDLDPCYIFHYNPGVGGYVMAPPTENIPYHPGMGFWVRTYEDNITIDAELQVLTQQLQVPLANGWNQIGNPFTFSVPVSELKVNYDGTEYSLLEAQAEGWVSAYLFGYDPLTGVYVMLDATSGCIEPWSGYWIRTYRDGCTLIIPPTVCTSASPASAPMTSKQLQERGIQAPPAPPKISLMGEQVLNNLTVCNIPNPIRSEHTTTFKVEGKGAQLVEGIRVEIYNQAGQKVFTQDISAKELEWHTDNDSGELLANGVYLYQVWVNIGGSWYPTGVHKLAVVR